MPDRVPEHPASGKEVCSVLVSYHPDADLPGRLARILNETGAVVVVDNGSGAEVVSMLGRLPFGPRVSVILNPRNLGVASALNIGIRRAIELGYAWVLLLDQDSVPNAGMVESLLSVRAAFPEPSRLAVIGAAFRDVHRGEGDAPIAVGAADASLPWIEVETVITSGSLIELAQHARIGPFREELFIDYVDEEYCFRARRLGYHVIQTREPLMAHAIGASTRHGKRWTTNHSPDRRYYIARNDTVMLREYGRFRFGLWAWKSLVRRLRTCNRIARYEDSKGAKIAAVAQGWWDGVRGRLGPRPGHG